ncbi:MAG: iron-containing alcohol dehydrogenase [Bacteroidales bacterium]|nr:iron-containing alcohol dehydrogenase [Bacteroidales bacterium]
MYNFIAYNPVKLHFGKNVVKELGPGAAKLGKKALLVYGGGSVLRNGSYRDTLEQLKNQGIDITEFNGIKPNPRVEDVMEATRIGVEAGVDMVVAVGGGSVIDSAKIIAICIAEECDVWELMTGKYAPLTAKPLLAVLTLAATGTEMNAVAVLQNEATKEKIGYRNELIYPVHSFLDPSYTQSVPANYTAYGIADLVAHSLEAWFGKGEATLSDRFVISVIQEALEFGPSLMKDLESYELRARIMWAATNALNNITLYGRASGDWGVHALGHILSFLYDTPHGATLSIIYPAWMKLMKERAGGRILQLGRELFGVSSADDTISALESFFRSLGSPVKCQEAGIDKSRKEEILSLMNRNRAEGTNYGLSDREREELLTYIF